MHIYDNKCKTCNKVIADKNFHFVIDRSEIILSLLSKLTFVEVCNFLIYAIITVNNIITTNNRVPSLRQTGW